MVVIEGKCFKNGGFRHRAPLYPSVQFHQIKVNSRWSLGGKGKGSYMTCFPGDGELQLAENCRKKVRKSCGFDGYTGQPVSLFFLLLSFPLSDSPPSPYSLSFLFFSFNPSHLSLFFLFFSFHLSYTHGTSLCLENLELSK